MKQKTPDILLSALRQYQHNDCSGLVAGFDYDETVKIVSALQKGSEWVKVTDRLPEKHQYVLLITDRYWNTPEGVPDMNVSAVGYLEDFYIRSDQLYWSIFGERGMDLDAFEYWMPIPAYPKVEE